MERKKYRIRNKIKKSSKGSRYRLSVSRSSKNISAQIIDDKNNYDGVTLVQFLLDIIENEVNTNKTLISTQELNEMDKPIYMTGVRNATAPYDIAKGLIKTQRDDDNILTVYEYLSLIHI